MLLADPVAVLSVALAASLVVVGALVARLRRGRRALPAAPQPSEPEAYLATVRMFSSVVDAGDPFTRGRSERVTQACLRIGERLHMKPEELRDLEYAALLHDIGKTAIHYDILLKAGRLSERETESVRNHPEIGYRILQEIPYLRTAAEIVLAHHEQPDGKGYPRKLSGNDIPMGSRIIMVVAAYDAMVCDRPYRQGLSTEEAFEELRKCSGKMFFGDVVEALIQLRTEGKLFTGASEENRPLFGGELASGESKFSESNRVGEPEKAHSNLAV